jgi:hypothetical protein
MSEVPSGTVGEGPDGAQERRTEMREIISVVDVRKAPRLMDVYICRVQDDGGAPYVAYFSKYEYLRIQFEMELNESAPWLIEGFKEVVDSAIEECKFERR